MNRFPARFRWCIKILGKVVDKKGAFRLCSCCLQRFLVNVWVRFPTSRLVGVDPMGKERKEIVGGFEMLDMGSTGIRDQGKGVVFRELTSEGHPFGEGIKNIAERLSQFFLRVGEIEILGQESEVLIASMVASFVVVSAFVRPDLFAEGLYALARSFSQGFQFFA